jgi:DNA-binding CsgD family transcriptional regulator
MDRPLRQAVDRGVYVRASTPPPRLGYEIDRACAALLSRLIDTDQLLRIRLDLTRGTATVSSGPNLDADPSLAAALARFGHLHPAVLSYLDEPSDRTPRRVSDVCRSAEWRDGPAYAEVFGPSRAIHQLSLVTDLSAGVGVGWVLTRTDRDFSDADVAIASSLLHHLTVMSRLAGDCQPDRTGPRPATLTPRENEIFNLLATGAAASTIARTLGISVTTARKHLAHIYDKLDVHDRLSAVLAMQSTGLDPVISGPSRADGV